MAYAPQQLSIGTAAQSTFKSVGVELILDTDTFEVGLAFFGGFKVGTDAFSVLGGSVHVGLGWKGDRIGQPLESIAKGWSYTVEGEGVYQVVLRGRSLHTFGVGTERLFVQVLWDEAVLGPSLEWRQISCV